jgi:subtilisin family serine protease
MQACRTSPSAPVRVVGGPRRPRRCVAVVAVVAALIAVVAVPATANAAPLVSSAGASTPTTSSAVPAAVDPSVASDVAAGAQVSVIVQLAAAPAGTNEPSRRSAAKQSTDQVLRDLPGPSAGGHQIGTLPVVVTTVDSAGLAALRSDGRVVQVSRNRRHQADVGHTTNITNIGAASAWAQGFTGAGQTIAIVDSGVDSTHAFLAGKVVSEACYSSAVREVSGPTYLGASVANCPGADPTQSTAAGSAVPCSLASECDHGTHVAGIAAGGTGGSFSGVAPGANLIAMDIFSVFTAQSLGGAYTGCGGVPQCAVAWDSDIITGLSRVDDLRSTYSIAAVNLSLGGGSPHTSACDSDPLAPIIGQLKSHGIAVVVAAGNDSSKTGLSSPACVSAAISVGATDPSSDTVTSFSDSSPRLSLLAPGLNILSSVLDNTLANDGFTLAPACPAPFGADRCYPFSGTSMATPHVAGAIAVLRQAKPDLGGTTVNGSQVDAELATLRATGKLVTDQANGVVTPRLQLDAAVAATPPPPAGAGLPLSFPGAVASNQDGRLETFRTDTSGAVSNIWQVAPNASWSGWGALGGQLIGQPTSAVNIDGRLELFGVDSGGRLTHSWQLSPGHPWSGWVQLGGQVSGNRFTVFGNLDGRLEIFAVGSDGRTRHSWQLNAGSIWSNWYDVTGTVGIQGISSIREPDGRAVVVAVDNVGTAARMSQTFAGGGWTAWSSIGTGLSGTPGFGVNPDSRLELFVAGAAGTLFHQWQITPGGSWSGVWPLGEGFNGSNLAVGRNSDGRLEVFSARTDGVVVHEWQAPGGGWSGVGSLDSAVAPLSIQVDADGRLELFSPLGRTHDWQITPGGTWSGWSGLP